MKITRRTKLLVVALALCITTMIGSTFAWFTDSVESGVNTITAGNLDMVVQYKKKVEDQWVELTEDTELFNDDALWEPGHTEVVALKIENKGNLAFKYQATANIISEVAGTNVYDQEFKLSDYLEVWNSAITQTGSVGAALTDVCLANRGYLVNNTQSNKAGFGIAFKQGNPTMPPQPILTKQGDAHEFVIAITMPTTVGNEANHNGKNIPKIMLGLNVTATQIPSESDSFGTDYDAGAEYPIIKHEVSKLNIAHTQTSYISQSANFSPILTANPEITGYSVYDGDTRITDAVIFRFSDVAKQETDENSYKVSFKLAILDDEGKNLELKPGKPSPINGKEYLYMYINLLEVPAGYAVTDVKVNGTSLTKTTNSNPATGEYMLGYEGKDVYLQSQTAGLIEVTVTKSN